MDLTLMIRNHLIEYYTDKEFGKEKAKLVSQNRKKTVDKATKR